MIKAIALNNHEFKNLNFCVGSSPPQVQLHNPVAFHSGNERVKPIQQQLYHGRLAKVLDAAVKPLLEGVRVIG